jgi:hypothetical protein
VTVWRAFAVSRSHHVPRRSQRFPGPEELNIRDSQTDEEWVLVIAQATLHVCEHDFGRTLMDTRAS